MVINATYIKHPDNSLNNNPLCEALPVLADDLTLRQSITRIPDLQDNFWELRSLYQKTQLELLDELYLPVSPHAEMLYEKFASLILSGYRKRNPLSPETVRFQMKLGLLAKEEKYFDEWLPEEQLGPSTVVSGLSGMGKTVSIRNTLKIIPQVIHHENYQGQPFKATQLVWISFDVPATSSAKALATNFFKAVDKAIGTDYYRAWSAKYNKNVDMFYGAIQVIIATHHIGLVHLDEVQFLLKYAGQQNSPNLQVIESLFNKLGVPIVLSMTSQGLDLFDCLPSNNTNLGLDITTTRRMLNNRQFTFKLHTLDSDSFNQLFDELFPRLLCTNGVQPDDEFKQRFHYLSCGLTAVMVRLAKMHHETVIELSKKASNISTNNTATLNKVYKGQFNLIDFALQHLRNGNPALFEQAITSNGNAKAAFSNEELKQQQAQTDHEKQQALPSVDKNDRFETSLASDHAQLNEGEFLHGIDGKEHANG